MGKDIKQVIVMRKDLKVRKGKMIAQACHASIMFMSKEIREGWSPAPLDCDIGFTKEQLEWIRGSFKKVCVGVESDDELLEIYRKARQAGLVVHMVTDSGKTEFHGVATRTCLAIGPDEAEKIDKVTGDLKLL